MNKKVQSPFKPKSDEVTIKKETEKSEKKKKDKSEKKKQGVIVNVDVDGLKDRIVALPIKASAYGNLASAGDNLYYTRRGGLSTKFFQKRSVSRFWKKITCISAGEDTM